MPSNESNGAWSLDIVRNAMRLPPYAAITMIQNPHQVQTNARAEADRGWTIPPEIEKNYFKYYQRDNI